MPDEVTEQTSSVIPGAEEVVVGAPEGVTDLTTEPVAGDSAAVPAISPTFDLSSDDGIRAAAEANPALKGYFDKLQADAANTARQRRDAEIRREQGSTERAQAYHQWQVSQLQSGVSPDELARQTPLYVKANEDFTRAELMRALLTQAASLGDETAAGLAESLTGAPEELTQAAQVTFDAALRRARADSVSGLTFDALPEGHALRAYLAEQIAAGIASEREAEALEERTAGITNPPNVSGSAPGFVGITPERALAMSAADMASLPEEDFERVKVLRFQAAGMT